MSDTAATGNQLGGETSPYLLQHKDNPVHWLPWGEEAFTRAAQEQKPVLLSIGYAACHWCHVMAHESFEDDTIAAQMNADFINIKVDREERPDVDTIYQHALQFLGEQGGWPLTMFLTPDREPFWGGTYFPPEDRYGRPGFPKVLHRISEIYNSERDKVSANATALKDALTGLGATSPGDGISDEILERAAQTFLRSVDTVHGGLGGAPKFPQCAVFEFLWRAWIRSGVPQYRDAVLVTLDRMSQGGIYDHLGGGFARYSVDPVWLVPHFEKMLYDNAQLIDLLTLAWRETAAPLYRERVEETVGWLMREMVVAGGGFAGTLDADSEGEEGKFYVWSDAEIDAVLGSDAPAFKTAYDVRPEGNWEGKTILNRSQQPLRGDDVAEAGLAASRARLLAERDKRIRPGLDDKVIADWNGMMIAALAGAAKVFDQPDWLRAAEAAFAFVLEEMTVNGRLRHTWRDGQARHPATSDDYAHLSRAAIALFESTQKEGYLAQAEAWIGVLDSQFRDPDSGAYNLSARDVTDVIVETRSAFDNATPSGNGTLVHVFGRLWYLTGNDVYRNRADELVKAYSGNLEKAAMGMPVLLSGHDLLTNGLQIVVVGEAAGDDTAALITVARQSANPNLVFRYVRPADELPESHPAHGKNVVNGAAAAYVCRGTTCSLPLTNSEALADALGQS